ncbi:SAM-dependent methyltransferase [Kutzneria albida]|uniref:SAM-dependent methyltransferase n=1 Tax=Kutzneria albida TaxID=43357 RepID=UPI0030841D7D
MYSPYGAESVGTTVVERGWIPNGIDLTRPSAARVYDAFLGGGHNFAVDREFARRAEQVFPGVSRACRANRAFLRRAVEFGVSQGVRQFLDIGSGIPTRGNVHEIAQQHSPDCRVVYVDNEAVAVAHSEMMLQGVRNTGVVDADLCRPEELLTHPVIRSLIDFDQPVMLLMLAVLHFVPDDEDPAQLVSRYMRRLAPGSLLAVTHATAAARPEEMSALERLYAGSTNPAKARTPEWIAGLFRDCESVPPGLCYVPDWRPDGALRPHPEHYIFYGGVGRRSAQVRQHSGEQTG